MTADTIDSMDATPHTPDAPTDGLPAAYTLLGHRPLTVNHAALVAAREQARRQGQR